MQRLSIKRPDDWHIHLRDGDALSNTVPDIAMHFARALVMPNLKPPLTDLVAIENYRQRIFAALPSGSTFTPYMTFYLNQSVTPEALIQASHSSYILGAKFYPAGATTNAELGESSLRKVYPLLEVMQAHDLVLQIHGEVTHGDIFDREKLFIEDCLKPLLRDFPKLRVVLEHISTKEAVEFVTDGPETLAATITAHHLYYNRNQLFEGGIKPHYYCLPILKEAQDQIALKMAAISGNPKFFAGTDSAPHAQANKESACGCAGIYSAPYALALYAEIFDELAALPQLEAFMSRFGAEFYDVPLNTDVITLVKQQQFVPSSLPFGTERVVPIAAGQPLQWSVHEAS